MVDTATSYIALPVAGSYTDVVSLLLLITVLPLVKFPAIVMFLPHSEGGRRISARR